MEKYGNCFKCRKPGHFAKECPEIFGNKRNNTCLTTLVTSTKEFPPTHCPCGAGLCVIKPQYKTGGRLQYHCPDKYDKMCEYKKFCDVLKANEILHSFPPMPYPICSCKAGVARIETVQYGTNAGAKYFICNVKKGNGACNFRLMMDEYYQSMLASNEATDSSNESIINEINMIYKQLENGEMELDFPVEEIPVEMDIKSPDEIFTGDGENSPCPSPRAGPKLDVREHYFPSGCKTEGNMQNSTLPTYGAEVEDLPATEGWWW